MGTNHACAVANGNGYCWGGNTNGQLGLGSTGSFSNPTQITGGTAAPGIANIPNAAFTAISAGNNFTCAIINGTASCWGLNSSRQLGNGTSNQSSPTAISGTAGSMQADAISTGDTHACANLQGRTYCWGNAANGRLGNNTTTPNLAAPALINGGANAGKATINIAAGGSSTCNVANGTIQCWGAGANGRLGNNATSDSLLPVTTGSYRYLTPYTKGPIF